MQWYYSKAGTQHGPATQAELAAKIASGEVTSTDLAWRDGMADWLPVSKIPEFQAGQAGGEAPASPVESVSTPSPYTPPSASAVPGGGLSAGQKIPTYLWQSIAVTCFCCLPFGIPAIVYAAKVDGLQARGDIAGALAASKSAKTWTIVSFSIGLVVMVVYIIAMVIGASAAASGQPPY
ncbi:MAG: CD225/dispanin family protein [Luteolibacter sp.]